MFDRWYLQAKVKPQHLHFSFCQNNSMTITALPYFWDGGNILKLENRLLNGLNSCEISSDISSRIPLALLRSIKSLFKELINLPVYADILYLDGKIILHFICAAAKYKSVHWLEIGIAEEVWEYMRLFIASITLWSRKFKNMKLICVGVEWWRLEALLAVSIAFWALGEEGAPEVLLWVVVCLKVQRCWPDWAYIDALN